MVSSAVPPATSGIFKKAWTFLAGEWGKPVGEAYRAAKTADPANVSIFKFDWKNTYTSEIGKIEAAKAAGATKSLWGKITSKMGPILTAIFFLPRIVKAFANDGIGEGLKETTKAAISLVGFALGGVVVGMLGLSGIGAFLIPIALSMAIDFGANKVLGESAAEKREVLLAQQKELEKNQSNFDIYKNDPIMASLKKRFDERNNYIGSSLMPSYLSGYRTQYYA
ncbi:MAG: hypothetical protein K6A44_06655 [bacterium]|nr:hypothetical protein [bacterium]